MNLWKNPVHYLIYLIVLFIFANVLIFTTLLKGENQVWEYVILVLFYIIYVGLMIIQVVRIWKRKQK